jgi:hypothetical protein
MERVSRIKSHSPPQSEYYFQAVDHVIKGKKTPYGTGQVIMRKLVKMKKRLLTETLKKDSGKEARVGAGLRLTQLINMTNSIGETGSEEDLPIFPKKHI